MEQNIVFSIAEPMVNLPDLQGSLYNYSPLMSVLNEPESITIEQLRLDLMTSIDENFKSKIQNNEEITFSFVKLNGIYAERIRHKSKDDDNEYIEYNQLNRNSGAEQAPCFHVCAFYGRSSSAA